MAAANDNPVALIEDALARGEGHEVPDDVLQRVFTAAARAYAAKVEASGREVPPFAPQSVSATEAVTTACAMIRAADLNMFDVTMWFNRQGRG
ncbi:MAG: hypothetical protein JWN93_2905 [Hyphomicrobiales bacterium]|nr:hypothetical protein [Hyphomicrobiales bacterium]